MFPTYSSISAPALKPIPDGDEVVPIQVGSNQSAVLNAGLIELIADKDCYIAFGANPVATNANMKLFATERIYRRVELGWRVAVIRDTDDGNLYISKQS